MDIKLDWRNIGTEKSFSYTCGYCSESVASEKAFVGHRKDFQQRTVPGGKIYICHSCSGPTFFDELSGEQFPGASFGNDVKNISDKGVEELYKEARNCYSSNSFTGVVLSCRKLLMHIAVSKGANTSLSFIEYVEFLSTNNFIPPDAKDWVDHIRLKGNEANHEIVIMKKEDAEDLLSFIEMLLKIIYEFPANIKMKTQKIP